MLTLNSKIPLLAFASFLCLSAKAQFTAIPDQTAQDLINILSGPNVNVTNATLNCSPTANAAFTYNGSVLPMTGGITLCTCETTEIGQPSSINATNALPMMTPGDSTLSALVVGTVTKDACVLECDVVADHDTLYLNYSFASEEYPEWNCTVFNDGFGFFITGPGFSTPTNFAKVPGTDIATTINSVNDGVTSVFPQNCTDMGPGSPFPQYYIDNTTGQDIIFDGMTALIEAFIVVVPGTSYHLKFAVANAIDGQYQSGVMLQSNSLSSRNASAAHVSNISTAGKMMVYPNPVKDKVSVILPAELYNEIITARVTNIMGQTALFYAGKGSGLNDHLKSKQISTGSYIMDLRADGYHQVLRFQKQD